MENARFLAHFWRLLKTLYFLDQVELDRKNTRSLKIHSGDCFTMGFCTFLVKCAFLPAWEANSRPFWVWIAALGANMILPRAQNTAVCPRGKQKRCPKYTSGCRARLYYKASWILLPRSLKPPWLICQMCCPAQRWWIHIRYTMCTGDV